jgi:hypothetical protein
MGAVRWVSRFPVLKRLIVDTIYRFPALDARLRSTLHRALHPDAVLDVDCKQLSEASRDVFVRLRARRRQ